MLLAAPQRPGRLPHGVRGGAAGLQAWRAAGADGVRQVPGQAVPLQRGAVDRAGDHREKRFPVIITDCLQTLLQLGGTGLLYSYTITPHVTHRRHLIGELWQVGPSYLSRQFHKLDINL